MSTTGHIVMRRTSLALLLASLAVTAFAAHVPGRAVLIEGRSTDARAAGQTTTSLGVQAINDATAAAVIGALGTRFAGQRLEFRLGDVRSERVSLRDLALQGTGQIRFEDGTSWLPIRFDALYDSATQIVESPAIVLGASTTLSSAKDLPLEALQLELTRRMNAEFASQTVALDMNHASVVGGDGRRVIVESNGTARFDQEDAVPVEVQAVYDRVGKRWIDASYEFTMSADTAVVALR